MSLHRLNAQLQVARNIFVAFALCEQLNDFPLARGQAICCERQRATSSSGLEVAIKNDLRYSTREKRLVPREALHGEDELARCFRLQEIPPRACREHLADQLLALMHGEHQHLDFWGGLPNAPGRFKPV